MRSGLILKWRAAALGSPLCWLALLLALVPAPLAAHEIPDDLEVQVLLQPETTFVRAAIQLPLSAMRDFDFATRGPGYLDLERIDPQLEDAAALWLLGNLTLYIDGEALGAPRLDGVRVALPSDRSFRDPDRAFTAIRDNRLPRDTNLYWEQALLEVALTYPGLDSGGSVIDRLAVKPSFARLGLNTITRIRYPGEDGTMRTLSLPGNPGQVSLNPGPLEVLGRFLVLGFEHVLDGTDHLLFVLALVVPLLLIRPLIVVVTAFTLAHSLTLGAAMLGMVPTGLWFPPLVELLIAASIFYMVLENLLKPDAHRRWLVAFAFGLVHGFGFSFALGETLERAGEQLFFSLLGFNLGIEAGQILVLLIAIPLLRLAGRWLPERGLVLVVSVLIGHTAWHWLLERWVAFQAFSVSWPAFDQAFAAGAMRWAMLVLIAGLIVWLVRVPFERWASLNHSDR
jgi:hypothetical protein